MKSKKMVQTTKTVKALRIRTRVTAGMEMNRKQY